MKPTLIFIALLISSICFSQSEVFTTEAEYNYLTKAYKIDMEQGRDLKNGYVLENLSTQPIAYGSNYTFDFKSFKRISENKICAVLVVMTSNLWGTKSYYFCIPFGDTGLLERYGKELLSLDANITRAYAIVSSQIMAGCTREYSTK